MARVRRELSLSFKLRPWPAQSKSNAMKKLFSMLLVSLVFVLVVSVLSLESLAENTAYETVIRDASFSSSSRTVIDEKRIRDSRAPNLVSLLSAQAGISISSTSFLPNSIYLRGGDPSHVLILVDGVPFYDASTSQRTINLNTLDIKTVRRVEIIRGSQSVLYGGQALAGVIKIETFPLTLSTQNEAQAQVGSNNLQQLSLSRLQILGDSSAVRVSASNLNKNSRSPVEGSDYRYANRNTTGEVSFIRREDSEWILKVYGSNLSLGLSGQDPTMATLAPMDTVDLRENSTFLGTTLIYRDLIAPWRPRFSMGFLNSDRAYTQPTPSTRDLYGGQTIGSRLELNPVNNDKLRLDLGLSSSFESVTWRSSGTEFTNSYQEMYGVFAKGDWFATKDLTVSLGSRYDLTRSIYWSNTAQFGLNWRDRIKFEVASGFKTPTIFQLYGYTSANPNLKPETSSSYSLTGETPLGDNQNVSATLFAVDFSDLIVATGSPRVFRNFSRTQTRGIETAYSARLPTETTFHVALGYQEPYDVTNARWLIRRPLQTGSAAVIQRWNEHTASLEIFGNGERLDNATFTRITTLGSFVVWNSSYSYSIPSLSSSIFARVSNLFDLRYDDAYGYKNEGLNGTVGIEFLN
jgi:iron complex outermembrane receptor protein